MADYQYDAFISYRHRPADQRVAIALQNRLERLKGPDGKKLRIFRDKTDLPISGDLSDGIKEALESSRFLIVICSPEYQKSKWCMAELTRFRQLHGNNNAHVLPVLVEGEPADVFPEELFWEEETVTLPDGTIDIQRVEIEPLGADVRGSHTAERLWKLRTEYLRLAAPILGKTFDALYQRDKRKQRWLWGSILTAVILGLSGFSLYNMHMRSQILAEHQAMLANESLRLAVASEQQLQQGNVKLAMALALEALPEDLENPERPLVPEAQTALRSAVYTAMAQQEKDLLQHITTLSFSTWGWELRGMYADGKILAVNDLETLCLYDASNGNLIFEYPSDFYAKAVLNSDATQVARVGYGDMEDGQQLYEMVVCAVPSGEVLFRQTAPAEPYAITVHWDTRDNVWYFVKDLYVPEATQILAAVQEDGSCITPTAKPDEITAPRFLDEISRVLPPAMDAALEDGQWTNLGESYREVLEPLLKQGEETILISGDRELVLIPGGLEKKDRLYSLPGLESGNTGYAALSGYYNIDTVNKRLLVSDDDLQRLHLYQYRTQNLVYQDPSLPEELLYITRDGSRCLFLGDPGIWDTEDLSAPLLSLKDSYTCVTPDLTCMLTQPTETQLQLWHTENGLLLELETRKPVIRSCINGDGSLIAVQYADTAVAVFDRAGNPVITVEPQESSDGRNDVLANLEVMELAGTDLLLSARFDINACSWIVDTTGQRETVVLPVGSYCSPYYGWAVTAHHLTEDGLLFCTGEYFNNALDAIYDVKTGQCVFRQVSYYQYDRATGILLYMPTNPQFGDSPVLHVARRDDRGVFRDLYTVSPENTDTVHWRAVLCADDSYFLVIGDSNCQVYSLEDGSRLLTLYDSDLSDEYTDRPYYLVSGTVYDTRYYRSGHLSSYPILEFDRIPELAEELLSSETGMRTLSYLEKEAFFLD